MLSRSRRDTRRIRAGPRSFRMTFPPSGRGNPVSALPPFPQVHDLVEALALVRDLAFVDDESCVHAVREHGIRDLVKGNHGLVETGTPEIQRQHGRRESAGDGDPFSAERLGRERRPRHDHGTVAIAHAGAVRQQCIAIGQVRVGVERNGSHLVLAPEGPLVEGLDVLQDVDKLQIRVPDLPLGQGIEHERVICVRAVGDRDTLRHATPRDVVAPGDPGYGKRRGHHTGTGERCQARSTCACGGMVARRIAEKYTRGA